MIGQPKLTVHGPSGAAVRAAVLLLHGGAEHSRKPTTRLHPAYLRMLPFAWDLRRAGWAGGVAVWQLCNRYRGWNKPDLDPVIDARWALAEIRRAQPDVPVVIVGHSMGGRVALRVADDPAVTAVCALAPWTPERERADQLAGRTVLIAHGDRDRVTKPDESYAYAERAKAITDDVCRFDVLGGEHAMLLRFSTWTSLVRRFVLGTLGITEVDHVVAAALAKPAPDGLSVPL